MKYEPVIGLEIHTELKTKTKMFCYSLNDPDEKHPNINICPVCMGHPGTLPVINQEAVEKVIKAGLALNGEIPEFSQFDRKNYFYPDLPKGYQISQYQHPLVKGGWLDIDGRRVRIRRIHLEEDTGRLIHDSKTDSSLVDFNRAGVPLLELVTEPDLHTGGEIKNFGEELQRILRYLDVSDADMEKGQLRVEVNLSLQPEGSNELGVKVEIKNINSFKFAADAVDYEIARQTKLLEQGEKIKAETRGWSESRRETFSQRRKEEDYDYRYFPEPDLPPLKISTELIEALRAKLPELPEDKRIRFAKEYGMDQEAIETLLKDKKFANYFEETVSELRAHLKESPIGLQKDLIKLVASAVIGDLQGLLKETSTAITDLGITPENFAELILYLGQDKISNLVFKKVLEEMFSSKEDPAEIIERLGLWQISDTKDLEDMARHIVRENSRAVADYHRGKEISLQFLVGQVMKESRGKANPKIIQAILKKIIKDV